MYLRRLGPGLLAYALSFFVIASWWEAHHRLFSPIVRYDHLLIRLNSFFLLVISITPFLVAILFDYGPGGSTPAAQTQLAIILYAAVQAVGGLILLGVWRHATAGHRLVPAELPAEWIRATEWQQWLGVGVFVVSMPVALLSPLAAELVWIAMVFGRMVRHRAPTVRRSLPPTALRER